MCGRKLLSGRSVRLHSRRGKRAGGAAKEFRCLSTAIPGCVSSLNAEPGGTRRGWAAGTGAATGSNSSLPADRAIQCFSPKSLMFKVNGAGIQAMTNCLGWE